MEQDLLTIVVPIYKVEKYLGKCVDSLRNQTYQNLEIILVDDGSPDGCGELCDQYALEDSRIKVIHKVNGGLSDARNAGIDIAKGKYIGFVDSDDYIHPQMFEVLYQEMKKQDVEIAVCGVESVPEDAHVTYEDVKDVQSNLIDDEEKEFHLAFDGETAVEYTVAWNKLYLTSLFDEIRYPYGKIHEDEFTTYKLMHKANKIIYVPNKFYYYVQRQGSIMSNGFNLKTCHKLEAYEDRLKVYGMEKKYDWYEQVLCRYRIDLMRIRKMMLENQVDLSIWNSYHKGYKKMVRNGIFHIPVSLTMKVGYLFSAYMPQKYYLKRFLNS